MHIQKNYTQVFVNGQEIDLNGRDRGMFVRRALNISHCLSKKARCLWIDCTVCMCVYVCMYVCIYVRMYVW